MTIYDKGNIVIEANYRLPWEFIFFSWKLRHALRVWFLYWWDDTMIDLWHDKGFRFMGIEFMKREYGKFRI
jgi:hypothetical protein